MTDTAVQQDPPHVVFGAKILEIATTEELDATTLFNGLATAAAATLVDFTADELGNVNQAQLVINVNKFQQALNAAVTHALNQLSQIVRATTI